MKCLSSNILVDSSSFFGTSKILPKDLILVATIIRGTWVAHSVKCATPDLSSGLAFEPHVHGLENSNCYFYSNLDVCAN